SGHSRRRRGEPPPAAAFRSRRLVPPTAEGRWTLVRAAARGHDGADRQETTRWAAAFAQQLLARHGGLTREGAAAEGTAGGFGLLYRVLKAMEDAGRLRRGYFVAGLGATQFALPGALDLLRSLRDPGDAVAPPQPEGDDLEVVVLSATDPANPYGAALKWPADALPHGARGPTRTVGAPVILVDGALAAYLGRGDRQASILLPEPEPQRSKVGRAVGRAFIERARAGGDTPRGMLIEEINGAAATEHPASKYLCEAGFVRGALGLQATLPRSGRRNPATVQEAMRDG